ncbi:MAG: zinc-binding dehydrogenase [Aigarchaeota archaeon]|nr:zinc-binding dehydrogenase [Aigarchaeota archaeon]
MKAAVYHGDQEFRVDEVPIPQMGAGEMLVNVIGCGLCSTDVARAKYGRAKPGSVLGHEIAGEVDKVGSGVDKFQPGDRVGVFHHAPCGACHYCLSGQEPLCEQYRKTNVDPGGFAQYIRVIPELVKKSVLHLPSGMSSEHGTLIEPMACCLRALNESRITSGETFLVLGDGPMGLMSAQVARRMGACQILVSGHHDYRLEKARSLGADYAFNSRKEDIQSAIRDLTEGLGADLVLVAAASTPAVKEATTLVRPGGRICVIGDFRDVPQPPLDLDPRLVLQHHVSILGSWGCSPRDYVAALKMLQAGAVDADKTITHYFNLTDFHKALNTAESKECLRVVLKP